MIPLTLTDEGDYDECHAESGKLGNIVAQEASRDAKKEGD